MFPFNLPIQAVEGMLLVFSRVAGIFLSAPVLNSNRVPPQVKVGFAFLMAMVLYPIVGRDAAALPGDILPYGALVLKEAAVGISIGFVANLLFSAVQMAGELADLQTGFAFASLVDPFSGDRTSIVGQFQMMFAGLVFLGVDGHHVLLNGVADSFRLLPLGNIAVDAHVADGVMSICSRTLVIALQIGAPVIGAVLLGDIALGLLARTVPQLNILVLGFPIKMLLGLIILLLALPLSLAVERNLVVLIKHAITYMMSFAVH